MDLLTQICRRSYRLFSAEQEALILGAIILTGRLFLAKSPNLMIAERLHFLNRTYRDLTFDPTLRFAGAMQLGAAGSLPVPPYGSRVRVFLSDLAEPATLLELPDVTGVAELSFDVVAVASGRDSEFLPEVYKGLFAPDVGESSSEQSVE